MNLPDIPEYVAGYFNFIIDFAISPNQACTPYKGSNKIDKNLLTYAAIGAALTWLTIALLKRLAEYHQDKTHLFDFVDELDNETIPLIALPCIISFSLLIHLFVRIILRFDKNTKYLIPTLVNCKNTINGALALFAFAPFIITFFFLITMFIGYNIPTTTKVWSSIMIGILILPISLYACWILFRAFPSAITSMQPDELNKPYRQAIVTSFGIFIFTLAALNWIIGFIQR